jgi:hypothetical protein
MKLSWLTVIAIVLLGSAAMLAYTWRDQDQKLRTGHWQRVELEVIRTQARSRNNMGGMVLVKWQDPSDHSAKDGAALITTSEMNSNKYPPGSTLQGWVHPGFRLLELSEAEPKVQVEQSFLLRASSACAALGLVLLAFAIKTGRIFA